MQFKGRDEYERRILEDKLDGISSTYLFIFEDVINGVDKFSLDKKHRKNLICQIDILQDVSNSLFQKRYERIMDKSQENVAYELAKLQREQDKAENALTEVFIYFRVKEKEVERIQGTPIIYRVVEEATIEDREKRIELQRRIVQEENKIRIQEENKPYITYDNANLMENLYLGLEKYPIGLIPVKDRVSMWFHKMIGKVKRNRNLRLTEGRGQEQTEEEENAHKRFENRMVNLANSPEIVDNGLEKWPARGICKGQERGRNENIR